MAIINGKDVRFVAEVPELMEQWDYERNPGVDPAKVTARSCRKLWFRCQKCKHSQFISPNDKTQHGVVQGCAACANIVVNNFDKRNSFGVKYPDFVQYWDYEKNVDTPYDIVFNSTKKRWLRCKNCGRSHLKQVKTFVKYTGCKYCSMQYHTSFGEDAVAYYLKRHGFDVVRNDRNLLDGLEIDILIPDMKIAIEYDGMFYHSKDIERMFEKYEKCKAIGYSLYRICELNRNDVNPDISGSCDWYSEHYNGCDKDGLGHAIACLLRKILGDGIDIDIDIKRDFTNIDKNRHQYMSSNSVASDSYLLSRWDHSLNQVVPESVNIHSRGRYWFTCPRCGRRWFASPHSVKLNAGCWKCRKFGNIKYSKIVEKELDGVTIVRVWDSAYDAAKSLGINKSSNISAASRGRYGAKRSHVAYGRYWDIPSQDGDK